MNRVQAKLGSRAGASMVFSLTVFCVAAVISLSLLATSMTAARSGIAQRRNEQAYLSDLAAARLLQDALRGETLEKTVWEKWSSPYPATGPHAAGGTEYKHSCAGAGSAGAIVFAARTNRDAESHAGYLTGSASRSEHADGLVTVETVEGEKTATVEVYVTVEDGRLYYYEP